MYPNGVLKHYQLRIGTLPILPKESSQESGTTILSRTAIRVSKMSVDKSRLASCCRAMFFKYQPAETSFSTEIIFQSQDSSEIYIQVRWMFIQH